jgi:uncharacterized membrane protein
MVFATVMALAMISFDQTWGRNLVKAYPIFEMSPPAARSILSSIVGAMVSTTGVVFSITIVALSLASSQFGSRLIRTYRKRRTTHFTLGIFVSTSLFCILVLASIREVNENAFVPTASVIVGILLTVVCLATLVYYIHDMSQAIQAPNVIQHSADDLDDAIERLFPQEFGKDTSDGQANDEFCESTAREMVDSLETTPFVVCCNEVGYLQAVENETVMGIAKDQNLIIRLLIRPGDFLYDGCDIAEVFCQNDFAADEEDELKQRISDTIRRSLIVGPNRTHLQDIRYAFGELVDIAVRALSPGVNDPFTAVNCVDRIHAALIVLKKRDKPSPCRLDDNDDLRVIASPVLFEECVQCSIGVIGDYAEGNPMVERRIAGVSKSIESHK